MNRAVPHVREVEALANLMLGPDKGVEPLPPPRPGGLGAALEAVLADALSHPPCVVSFSGGRDSSAVLALATDVARRHGLSPPIPVTMRWAGAADTDETSWQEMVLRHIGLDGVQVLELTDELDALGTMASDFLRVHGLRWPGNAYMHRPVIDVARGGTLMTGIGGDELFSNNSPRRSIGQLARAGLPRRMREEVRLARGYSDDWRWLTPEGSMRVRRSLVRDELSWPYRWDRSLHYWYASRAFAAIDGALALVAAGRDVAVINPFVDRQVLAELGRLGGRRGFPSRTEAMRRVCGDLLPDALISRPTKASFSGAIWGPRTREFMESWSGGGLNPHYVDEAKLRAEIDSDRPDFRTILLVHQAWLHDQGLMPASS